MGKLAVPLTLPDVVPFSGFNIKLDLLDFYGLKNQF